MGNIEGRVGGAFEGFGVYATIEAEGTSIRGRMGGMWLGGDINLSVRQGEVTGRLGGAFHGQSLTGELRTDSFIGRVGGAATGQNVSLWLNNNHIEGRVGGETLGFSCALRYAAGLGTLTGRLGGEVIGHTVSLTVSGASPLLAALLAALTYHYYQFSHTSINTPLSSR